jgi:alpha-beta hydrolase superfamily lysophospholipase
MSTDYSALDIPEVSAAIFHPRPETTPKPVHDNVSDHQIPVAANVHIGARYHCAPAASANILFFHGNGEIAADYDELGPVFNGMGINLLVADYRGYGCSNGRPTVSAMMADCHVILDHARVWLRDKGHNGPMIVMGRSLGSASALELAAAHTQLLDGLIIESGFAYAGPLLRLLGIDPQRIGFSEEKGFSNLEKIRHYPGPTLIIHAEFDHIIPFSDGRALFDASPCPAKQLLEIPGANHNDILIRGFEKYMQAIRALLSRL